MKVRDLPRIKGREVITVRPDATLAEVIGQLVNHHIGAVPVCDARGTLVGIISERDILKWLHKGKADVRAAKAKDVMTAKVTIGNAEDEIEAVLKTMSEKGIRHLPLMAGDKLVGILSMRDIVDEQLRECTTKISTLNEYIAGGFNT
jgi:CBS domain-containing protein